MKIAVIGEPEFTLGFQLTGIREVINVYEEIEANKNVEVFLQRKDLGVVIIDEPTINKLDERVKEEVIQSINPVFVSVSKTSSQDELRKMILQSIGVDLLKGE